jgi:hypothetical protein
MVLHMGTELSRRHRRRRESGFLWVLVPFNIRLDNLALLVLHDDAIVGGPQLRQHPHLLVGELHFFSKVK